MKLQKVGKLATNLHDKTEYLIPIRNLKQALNQGLILTKVHTVIKFNQKYWQKYITQSYFAVPKNVRVKKMKMHYLEIPDKREL